MDELYSINAECAVLGGVMIDAKAYERVTCVESDFGVEVHRTIWRAIVALREEGQPIDILTVDQRLTEWNEDVGGIKYLHQLTEWTPSAANIAGYAQILREYAVRRGVMSAATSLQETARDPSRDTASVIDEAQRNVLALSMTGQESRLAPLGSYIQPFLDDLEKRVESDDGMVGTPTGHDDVDRLIHGFEGGDFIVVAGRPSMGKTLLVEQWGEHMAANSGPVAFFSLEMPGQQLLRRSAARNGKVAFEALRSGRLEQHDWHAISDAMARLRNLPLHIDDTGGLSFAELRSRARRLHRKQPLSAVIVDYLQIVQPGEGVANDARADQKIAHVASGLKALAKELDIPVIAVAQLNRSVDSRSDKRPQMSDLRESGQVEQDADVIAFIYRDEVYHDDSPAAGTAELIVRKQRNGPAGTVRLAFMGEYQRFENFAGEIPQAQPKTKPAAAAMDY